MLDLNHALSESRKLHFFFCLSSFLSLQFTHLISPIRSISQWSCLENNVLLLIESKLVSFFVCFISSLYGCLSPSVPRFMLCIVVLWICPLIMLNKVVHRPHLKPPTICLFPIIYWFGISICMQSKEKPQKIREPYLQMPSVINNKINQ